MPMMGRLKLSLSDEIAAPVAVLHATTIAFEFSLSRNLQIAIDLCFIQLGVLVPYGR